MANEGLIGKDEAVLRVKPEGLELKATDPSQIAANLLLVVLCVVTVKIGVLAGIFNEPNSVNFRHIVDPGSRTALTGLATVISMIFTLNLVLGPMSVLVHGVRLNVLEFCSHIDIKWTGFPYRPLHEEGRSVVNH